MSIPIPNRIGFIFTNLEVVDKKTLPDGTTGWSCLCVCGNTTVVRNSNLISGSTKSCGCMKPVIIGNIHRTHGESRTLEYKAWNSMISRCKNEHTMSFVNYGGRGIEVCDRWLDYNMFLADMGRKPTKNHSIERKNNDGNYTPDNCIWATKSEQDANKRSSVHITFKDRTQTVAQWSKEIGMKYNTLYNRLLVQKLPPEEAFTKPIGRW